MKKTKLAFVGVGAAALVAAGVGTAFANPHSSSVRPAHTQVVPARVQAPVAATADDPNGPNDQVGDQTTADTGGSTERAGSEKASAPEKATESSSSEKAGASDGPGGYADPEGSDANTQQEGEH